jgi:hypothetical protein
LLLTHQRVKWSRSQWRNIGPARISGKEEEVVIGGFCSLSGMKKGESTG